MNSMAPPGPQGTTGDGAEELVRAYRVWEGSNVFCLGGRLIFGPDARSILLTIFLILAPSVVFCVTVARNLMNSFSNHWGIAIMVAFVVLTVYVLVVLLLTSSRDPGIIPRNAEPPEQEDQQHLWSRRATRIPPTKDVVINGVTVKIKYCDTCKLYRPPRCSHCSICDNCVERFDHHCPWVGQCIGLRNYRFYFMFIFSATLLCLYVHGFCWVNIVKISHSNRISIGRAMIRTPQSIVLIIYTFLALWFVGGLSVFHLYLISTNQTTYENFRYSYNRNASPYNKGIVRNFLEKFCTSIPASKNHFRAKVPKRSLIHSLSVGSSLVGSSFLMNSRREQEHEHELGKSNRMSMESDDDDSLLDKWQEKPLVN